MNETRIYGLELSMAHLLDEVEKGLSIVSTENSPHYKVGWLMARLQNVESTVENMKQELEKIKAGE